MAHTCDISIVTISSYRRRLFKSGLNYSMDTFSFYNSSSAHPQHIVCRFIVSRTKEDLDAGWESET
jgi:hypothetical protein